MNNAAPKTSVLAIVALVCSFLCMPVGLILGVVALVRINNSQGQLGGKGWAIAALIVPVAAIPIIGILSAIAIPNFIRFQLKSKQSEAKMVLRSISSSQEQFYADAQFYVPAALTPSSDPTTMKEAWEARPCAPECGKDNRAACNELSCVDFSAPGPVYFRYACATGPAGDSLACAAIGDIDGDGTPSVLLLVVKGGAEALTEPLPSQAIAACATTLIRPGEIIDCTPSEF